MSWAELVLLMRDLRANPAIDFLIFIAPLAAGASAVLVGLLKYLRQRRLTRAADRLAAMVGVKSFSDLDIQRAREYYVEPSCSNVDPSSGTDLRAVVSVREPALQILKREIDNLASTNHILLLADSGMGKTTLLLNLFLRWGPILRRKDVHIAIVPLGHEDPIAQIIAIPNQRNVVLLLDAFDEDTVAAADHATRLDQLVRAGSSFRKMIITCRTQFFANDLQIPRDTRVRRAGPRPGGETGTHQFQRIYLLPFDNAQTLQYIRARIPFWRPSRRARALTYVSTLEDLAMRPMLLAQIPELVAQDRDIRESYELYEFMVKLWFKREAAWVKEHLLERVSRLIAVDLLQNRQQRGSESISAAELDDLLRASGIDIDPSDKWKITARSLLNRNAEGRWKFSHRSILEYFAINALLDGDSRPLEFEWTDQMKALFLSWGRMPQLTERALRAKVILSGNLIRTNAFPVCRFEVSRRVNVVVEQVGRHIDRLQDRLEDRVPLYWFSFLQRMRVIEIQSKELTVFKLTKFYDLCGGVCYTMPTELVVGQNTRNYPWRRSRSKILRLDGAEESEMLMLADLNCFLRTVDSVVRLTSAFQRREIYWLRDNVGDVSYAFSVRSASDVLSDEFSANFRLVGEEKYQSIRSGPKLEYIVSIFMVPFDFQAIYIEASFCNSPIEHQNDDSTDQWADDYCNVLGPV